MTLLSHAIQSSALFCAIVVSFPRSGTHFSLDFLRRNFAEFAFRPRLWESSESLYVNLDVRTADEDALAVGSRSVSGKPRAGRDHWLAAERPNFLVKTHDLPFHSQTFGERLEKITNGHLIARLYPFRRMSSTVLSFHAHQYASNSIGEFLASPDPYLGSSHSIMETMIEHGEWGLKNAVPIDIDDMLLRPHDYGRALAARFGWHFTPPANPLPPIRLAPGMVGEFIERMRGRQSTEVVIERRRLPRAAAAFIDNEGPLADLYSALKAKALSPK